VSSNTFDHAGSFESIALYTSESSIQPLFLGFLKDSISSTAESDSILLLLRPQHLGPRQRIGRGFALLVSIVFHGCISSRCLLVICRSFDVEHFRSFGVLFRGACILQSRNPSPEGGACCPCSAGVSWPMAEVETVLSCHQAYHSCKKPGMAISIRRLENVYSTSKMFCCPRRG